MTAEKLTCAVCLAVLVAAFAIMLCGCASDKPDAFQQLIEAEIYKAIHNSEATTDYQGK